MKCRCGHNDVDHVASETCHEQIHYPNEDYPCPCGEFVGDDGKCSTCGHLKSAHALHLRCRPANNEICSCLNFTQT